jgi:hypothetical protein
MAAQAWRIAVGILGRSPKESVDAITLLVVLILEGVLHRKRLCLRIFEPVTT